MNLQDLIHQKPVMAGLVCRAEDSRLSNIIYYVAGRQCGSFQVDILLSNLKQHSEWM